MTTLLEARMFVNTSFQSRKWSGVVDLEEDTMRLKSCNQVRVIENLALKSNVVLHFIVKRSSKNYTNVICINIIIFVAEKFNIRSCWKSGDLACRLNRV
jgi:hypothetical protein